MMMTDTPGEPLEKCSLDIVGPITATLNSIYIYILSFRDLFSKYTFLIPLENQEVETIARAFMEQIVFQVGMPKCILKN